MSLAPFIHAMGRGPGRARSLTQDEAREAMRLILSGEAAPEAVGALLMLMRYRGETAAEIAGFVGALRDDIAPFPGPAPDIDWPSYAAGRSRGLPWFLLSARLMAQAGLRVLIHGQNSHQASRANVRDALAPVGIPVATGMADAARLLAGPGIAYLPLEGFSAPAARLLALRGVLGLRSAINTTLRCLNPGRARVSLQGVFHPPYRALQTDAGRLLGQPAQGIIKGGGGEFERNPMKDVELFTLQGVDLAPALLSETRRLSESGHTDPGALQALWSGALHDPFAAAVVTGTAALGLFTAGHCATLAQGLHLAETHWAERHGPQRRAQ